MSANGLPVVEDQSEAIAFLCDPATHGLAEPPPRFDTHGAVVVLARDTAYKMKRAVRFPFMDFSTLALRRAACEAELAVNRAQAPELYRDVIAITRGPGGLVLGGAGEPVEWLVRMARFDETRTLDRLAEKGPLPDMLLADLVKAVVASHAAAPLRRAADTAASLARYVRQNEEAFADRPDLFPPAEAAELAEASRAALRAHGPLLAARATSGQVRRCHGDLHLRNIATVEGRPVLFDAIEFDEDIATCDLLYDLAFLVMDLWERGHPGEANRVLSRYGWITGPETLEGLPALPLFLSVRAALRAKIEAAEATGETPRARAHGQAARRYFTLAREALVVPPPRLVAVGGLSGTGKSTLAAALAPTLGGVPGALHWRSDVERKRLAGVAETERLGPAHYTPEMSREVYARLLQKAAATLRAGRSAVLDAVFARQQEREAAAAVAREAGTAFAGLWLEADGALLAARVAGRRDDASDADAAVVQAQSTFDCGPVAWARLDASARPEDVASEARALLARPSPSEGGPPGAGPSPAG